MKSKEAEERLTAAIHNHADAILRAAGSSLNNYTMPATRQAILAAVLTCHQDGYYEGVEFGVGAMGEA